MRFLTTQLCDNPHGDECQYEDIGETGPWLHIEPQDSYDNDELLYCEDCAWGIIEGYLLDEGEYPRRHKDETDLGYKIEWGEKRIKTSSHTYKIVPEVSFYLTKEDGEKLYEALKEEGYRE